MWDGAVPMLGIEGETLEGVYDAIELVESTKQGVPPALHGLNVAVIGAGNTAVDAATCSVRLGQSACRCCIGARAADDGLCV